MKFLTRKPNNNQFSLERLNRAFFSEFDYPMCSAPFLSKGIKRKMQIMLWAWSFRKTPVHILGDIHFVTWCLKRNNFTQTVHDIDVLKRSRGIKKWLLKEIWFKGPINRSLRTVCVSEATRKQVLDHIPEINPDKLIVIHNAFVFEVNPISTGGAEMRFDILTIGSKKNKNLIWVNKAVRQLGIRWLAIGNKVQILGEIGEAPMGMEILENVSELELLKCYKSSRTLVMASIDEGFGLPILEAQLLGTPVICTDLEVFQEVAGKGAMFVPLNDTESLVAAIKKVEQDDIYRAKLVSDGVQNLLRFEKKKIRSSYDSLFNELNSKF